MEKGSDLVREIKFRALAPKIDGKWHYGSFIENTKNDFDCYILEDDGNETKVIIDRETIRTIHRIKR